MEKKRIITLSGKPGSGKSTASKLIASQLGYTHFSSGDLFRTIAKERSIDVYQVNVLAETEKEIDHLVDQKLQDLGREEDTLVIDSRMAWHWMPYSFKVYLDLEISVAAARILANMSDERIQAEHIPNSPSAYADVLQKRLESEIKRYANLYNANPYDTKNYDLIIDTRTSTPEEAADTIISAYNSWLKK